VGGIDICTSGVEACQRDQDRVHAPRPGNDGGVQGRCGRERVVNAAIRESPGGLRCRKATPVGLNDCPSLVRQPAGQVRRGGHRAIDHGETRGIDADVVVAKRQVRTLEQCRVQRFRPEITVYAERVTGVHRGNADREEKQRGAHLSHAVRVGNPLDRAQRDCHLVAECDTENETGAASHPPERESASEGAAPFEGNEPLQQSRFI